MARPAKPDRFPPLSLEDLEAMPVDKLIAPRDELEQDRDENWMHLVLREMIDAGNERRDAEQGRGEPAQPADTEPPTE